MKEYGWCVIDSHKQRIGNFKIEPPGMNYEFLFRIQIGNSVECVTVDLLKPAYLDETEEVELAEPRKRGCPPNKNPIPQDQKVNKESATPKRRGRPPKKKL